MAAVFAGCYGTLGLESGGVADTQLSASSAWEWNFGRHREWAPSGARLKKAGPPWVPAQSDQQQWLQVDFKREKRITGTLLHARDHKYTFIIIHNNAKIQKNTYTLTDIIPHFDQE